MLTYFDQRNKETKKFKDYMKARKKSKLSDKVKHVLKGKQTREHICHWPRCGKQVPPAMWGCKKHWFMLPKSLRDRIWTTYRPGQEITMTPSKEYLAAADAVQEWIKEQT